MTPQHQILVGDCLQLLRKLPDQSIHCCVTSPPYFGLRDYGVEGQIGLEETPAEFIARLVEVFREVRRSLLLELNPEYAALGRARTEAARADGASQMDVFLDSKEPAA